MITRELFFKKGWLKFQFLLSILTVIILNEFVYYNLRISQLSKTLVYNTVMIAGNSILFLISKNKTMKNSFLEIQQRYGLSEKQTEQYLWYISFLQEENKEKDHSINLFIREMSELLQAHEKNCNLLIPINIKIFYFFIITNF